MTIATTAEPQFWNWFQANEDALFHFERQQEEVFDSLSDAMSQVHADLTFEFGPVKRGKREFVISAAGIKSAFPAVEALFAAAPHLPRWTWTKFRPGRSTVSDIEFGEVAVAGDDVRYLLARDGDKIGILLFLPGFQPDRESDFGQIGYLMLDEALGELAVETQVGFIEIMSKQSEYFDRSLPLQELPAHFDKAWQAMVQ